MEKGLLLKFFSSVPPTKNPNIPEPLIDELTIPLLFFCSSETVEYVMPPFKPNVQSGLKKKLYKNPPFIIHCVWLAEPSLVSETKTDVPFSKL